MKVVTNILVVIFLQFINLSNKSIVHPTLTQCYVSITSQSTWEEGGGNIFFEQSII